jgi:hypothetical protein
MNDIDYNLHWGGKYFATITLPAHPANKTRVKTEEYSSSYIIKKITMVNNSNIVKLAVGGRCPFPLVEDDMKFMKDIYK